MKQAIKRLGTAGIVAAVCLGIIWSAFADMLKIEDPAARAAFMTIGGIVAVIFILWLTSQKGH